MYQVKQLKAIFIGFLCIGINLLAKEEDDKAVKQEPIGNFSVPFNSQIGPLVSFGQFILDKDTFVPVLGGYNTVGHDSYANVLAAQMAYGIRNDFSVLLNVPYNIKSKEDSSHSSGIKDIYLQLEYAYFSRTRREYSLEGTIVANVQLPTGSSTKVPSTGNGSYTYFLGTTFSYMSPNWYAFISPGANLTTTHHQTRFGNSYLYQVGFARYIKALSPKGCIFDLMMEFDGTYIEKSKIKGIKDPDSGGNIIFATPSIWLSSKGWFFQWGVGFPIVQNLNGKQDKIRYFIAYNLGLIFQF